MKNGYQIYNQSTHNVEIQAALQAVQNHYQFVPNALGAMAESPQAVKGYLSLDTLVNENALTPEERHVVFLTIAREYNCPYCVAAHTAFAQMGQVDQQMVQDLREEKPLPDKKLDALSHFTQRMIQTGCSMSDTELEDFLNAGYTRRHVLDIITMMSNKLISIFANRVMGTDLDEMLKPCEWAKV